MAALATPVQGVRVSQEMCKGVILDSTITMLIVTLCPTNAIASEDLTSFSVLERTFFTHTLPLFDWKKQRSHQCKQRWRRIRHYIYLPT